MEKNSKIILGVDPGSLKMGYGLLSRQGSSDVSVISYGTLQLPPKMRLTQRYQLIFHEIKKIIDLYRVEHLVVETQFIGINPKSTLTLNMCRAVIMLAATELSIPVFGYSPCEIKQALTGRGNATKEQMKWMVERRLNLKNGKEEKKAPLEDEVDALSIALCHILAQASVLTTKKEI